MGALIDRLFRPSLYLHGGAGLSEFHYVRTRGPDGGVDACDGPAIGVDLETVLRDGLPPWKIALEIVAALCEMLDIADQDGQAHGEIHPKYVFIDETGAVSLEGFGVERGRTRAPEGAPKGTRTDLYGLGYTALRCFSSYALPDEVPADADAHDDLVIDAALDIDLTAVDGDMQGDIQWFVAKLMSFDPEERPAALEAWRTFVAFAAEVEGPDLAEWCAAALDGGGERRHEAKRPGAAPEPRSADQEEELGGPSVHRGPLSGRRPSFEDGGTPTKDGATAFWTRDEMKKALDKVGAADSEDTTQDEGPPMGTGGGSATSFWTREQIAAMQRGDVDAPRPRRAEGEAERRKAVAAQTGTRRRPASDAPVVAPRTPPPPTAAPPARAARGSRGRGLALVLLGGVVAFAGTTLVLSLATVLILVAVVVASRGPAGASPPPTLPAPVPAEAAPAPTPEVTPEPDHEPRSAEPPSPPRASPVPAAPKPSSEPAPRSRPRPSPAPASGDARVQLRTSGRGQVQGCSENGNAVQFDGLRNFVIPAYMLPATCLVTMDGARAVFQVTGTGDVTCDKQGSVVTCDKTTIP